MKKSWILALAMGIIMVPGGLSAQANRTESEVCESEVLPVPGAYTVTTTGKNSVRLKVVIGEEGELSSIELLQIEGGDDAKEEALQKLIDTIVENQKIDVDNIPDFEDVCGEVKRGVAGAIRYAKDEADLSEEELKEKREKQKERIPETEPEQLEYTVTANGYEEGPVTLTVIFERGTKIGEIHIEDMSSQTDTIGQIAAPETVRRILEAGSTDVDAVTGATKTCEAVKQAVNEAIEKKRGQ